MLRFCQNYKGREIHNREGPFENILSYMLLLFVLKSIIVKKSFSAQLKDRKKDFPDICSLIIWIFIGHNSSPLLMLPEADGSCSPTSEEAQGI